MRRIAATVVLVLLTACASRPEEERLPDAGPPPAGQPDAGQPDAGPGQACTPDSTTACTCDTGRPGTRTCGAEGTLGACTCLACGAVPLAAQGVLHTSVADIPLDGAEVKLVLEHASTSASGADTCLAHAVLEVSLGTDKGCVLELEYGAAEPPYGGVRLATLGIGPACPGFVSRQEGLYASAEGWGAGWWNGPRSAAPGATCHEDTVLRFPAAPLRLSRTDGTFLEVRLDDVVLRGDMPLRETRSPYLACFQDGCGPERHDGGNGWCTPLDTCSPGFHDGGDGACRVVGTCSPGYALDPDGTCHVWKQTGKMVVPRTSHAAFKLPSGDVLVVGGYTQGSFPHDPISAERYDAKKGTWSEVGKPIYKHEEGTFSQLANGRVLAAGGFHDGSGTSGAELYDPTKATWQAAAPMGTARYYHSATTLADGRVLVTGGQTTNSEGALTSAELYDPATNTWAPTGSMTTARTEHASVLLSDGGVLIIAGLGSGQSAELYDPNTGTFTRTADLPSWSAEALARRLADGRVLLTSSIFGLSALYDPVPGSWTYASIGVSDPTSLTLLRDGRVLVMGWTKAGLFAPATDTWTALPAPGSHPYHQATLLEDGRVLVSGGGDGEGASSAELYVGGF